MENDNFVKIENKKMPIDNFKSFDLEFNRVSQSGFTNIVFLIGGIVTAFMWGTILFLGR